MQRETFDQYLKRLDDLEIGAKNPNFIKEIQKAKEKLISVMPPPSFTIQKSWVLVRGKSIHQGTTILMNPFDLIDFCRSIAKDTTDCMANLDTLQKTMHEFIDMKCPKYLS